MDFSTLCLLVITFSASFFAAVSQSSQVPALFAFGDSLVDAGNNDFLKTQSRANHPPYGIDFVNHVPTGRFSNGRLVVDFIATYLGLPFPPPFYAKQNITEGANFASGSSGVLPSTHLQAARPFQQQVDDFQTLQSQLADQMGPDQASTLISQSIFYICTGNNDVNNQFETGQPLDSDFLQSVLDGFTGQIHRLYDLGARKFVIVGLSAVGCVPLNVNPDGSCAQPAQDAAASYNRMLRDALDDISNSLSEIHIVITNFYDLMVQTNANPQSFGFLESTRACCTMGSRRLDCNKGVKICPDRSQSAFWDGVHQTEAFNNIAASRWWSGGSDDVYPMNISELAAL